MKLEGRTYHICRAGRGSPNLQVLSGNSQQLEYVLDREGQRQEYGPDRQWNNKLFDGKSLLASSAPELLRIVRDVPEERMQLVSADGHLLTNVDRLIKNKGYNYPDIRHRFVWKGTSYLLEAKKVFSGKNFTITDETSSAVVLAFTTTLKTFFKARQVGKIVVTHKVSPEDQPVLVGAFLAFEEWDARRTCLTFGDYYFNQDVVP